MTTEKTATFFTKLKKILWIVFLIFFFSVYAGYILWCTGAICYAPMPLIFRIPAVIIFLPLVISAPFIKPRIIFLSGGIALLLMCSILWSLITPTNRKLWVAEYARLPKIEWLDEDAFRIRDIRDFHFFTTTDYMVRYTDEVFDLDKLKALDYITVYWPQLMEKEIAHIMLRFRFSGNKNVLVSCETRRTTDGEFGGVNNLFKQSGLIYVFATERDILALRTNIRNPEDQVFIYEMDLSSEQRKKIFRHLAERVNSLHTEP
ncbi:MAG: DUF4105 domain-containing protein, partial [Lentisphaeria bacterium]|nr:DUF4105 domain-containing protein [Lentisphaeria bacterium]